MLIKSATIAKTFQFGLEVPSPPYRLNQPFLAVLEFKMFNPKPQYFDFEFTDRDATMEMINELSDFLVRAKKALEADFAEDATYSEIDRK